MKQAVALVAAAFGLTLLPGCAARLPFMSEDPKRTPISEAEGRLAGSFETAEGQRVSLEDDAGQSTVVVFSQDTCVVCAAEAQSLRASLRDPAQGPNRIRLYTILVGATAEDAADWKSFHRVPWTVGTDPDAALFNRYCETKTVPCTIVQTPAAGIVLKRNGVIHREELERLSGAWEENS